MAETITPAPGARTIEALGKWIALVGSVIAVGQAATAWINGQWQAEAAKEKAKQELALADLKERSALASEYLRLIISKDSAPAERVTLLSALGSIEKHPLQQWAQERHAVYREALVKSEAAFQKQREAVQAKEGAEQDEAVLRAEIEKLNSDIQLDPDNRELRERVQPMIIAKSAELARVRARLSLAVVRIEDTRAVVSQAQQGIAPSADPRGVAGTITELSEKITAARLTRYFPAGAAKNIEIAAPFLQSALQEFKVTDKRMVAAIVATIAVEDPLFAPYEEPEAQAIRYDGKLGNTQPGDGVRYRGRGYIGMTGRANYARMSARLGLGTRLVDSPDDAKSPEIASRVLVAWFVDRLALSSNSLDQDYARAARAAVSGSSTSQIARFTDIYQRVLADL
jgi:predicted chitinase